MSLFHALLYGCVGCACGLGSGALLARDWDGETDSLFQEFDQGKRFMEYKFNYGTFNDVPINLMNSEMQKYYPHLFEESYDTKEFSFKFPI